MRHLIAPAIEAADLYDQGLDYVAPGADEDFDDPNDYERRQHALEDAYNDPRHGQAKLLNRGRW